MAYRTLAIDTTGLSKHFGANRAVQDISLEIPITEPLPRDDKNEPIVFSCLAA